MTDQRASYHPKNGNGLVWLFNEETLDRALTEYFGVMPEDGTGRDTVVAFLKSAAAARIGLQHNALPS